MRSRTCLCLLVAIFLQSCVTECIECMFLKYLATEASEVLGKQLEWLTGWPFTWNGPSRLAIYSDIHAYRCVMEVIPVSCILLPDIASRHIVAFSKQCGYKMYYRPKTKKHGSGSCSSCNATAQCCCLAQHIYSYYIVSVRSGTMLIEIVGPHCWPTTAWVAWPMLHLIFLACCTICKSHSLVVFVATCDLSIKDDYHNIIADSQ